MLKKKWINLLSCLLLAVIFCSFPIASVSATDSGATWNGTSSGTDWTGNGISSDPYVISTAAQFRGLADSVNSGTTYSGCYFILGGDIDLAGYAWAPIGGACALSTETATLGIPTGNYFAGVFDGRNHSISGINISNPVVGTGAYGLFGYVNGGTIANLSVAGSLNMGNNTIDEIGSVVGYTSGDLYNLHSSMTIYMYDPTEEMASQAGGIAGVVENRNSNTTIHVKYCSNTGNITARGRIGGIVGAVYSIVGNDGGVVVDQCFNTGSITSTDSTKKIFTGGVVGYCTGYLTNCYNQGVMKTNNGHYICGIVGILNGSIRYAIASMSDCYSTAVFLKEYSTDHDRFLYGSVDSNNAVAITDCFYVIDASNTDMSQPTGTAEFWGDTENVMAVTAEELQGAVMVESGYEDKFIVADYLGSADVDNASGAFGFAYLSPETYPVLGWQLFSYFIVDISNGNPSPEGYFAVTASVNGSGGTVTVDQNPVSAGGTCIITFNPDNDYNISTVTDNGVSVAAQIVNNTYTISNTETNHVIIVSYTDTNIPIWDLNQDHVCDVSDLVAIGLRWGQTGISGWVAEDINKDGVIDVADLVAIGLHWGESY